MKRMNKIAIIATAIGMVAAMASGNTNNLLANGFLMVTVAILATRD